MSNLINVFYGVSTDIPLNVDNLKCEQVSLNNLLKNGLKVTLTSDDEYSIIATEKSSGIKPEYIKLSGFQLESLEAPSDNYYILYGEEPSTDTATIICNFIKE